MQTAIISIEYKEPEWAETKKCIEATELPAFYVDRQGTGSLAKAINDGVKTASAFVEACGIQNLLIVTNVTFEKRMVEVLDDEMQNKNMAAITPAFNSDHAFCKPRNNSFGVMPIPFAEFTCLMVNYQAFKQLGGLDEDMPYWGHDVDFGYRARKAGYLIGVSHSCTFEHTYIRFSDQQNEYRKTRHMLRKATDFSTEQKLIKLYGKNWKSTTGLV